MSTETLPSPGGASISQTDLDTIGKLRKSIDDVIVGKSEVVKLVVTCLLARGHVLIEDIPGIGKTSLARALARSISCTFKRVQFTPDLLPSDVTGLSILDQERQEFIFKPGPIFANIILADEINRTTPRTQSALLEAMNENRVTVDGKTHTLPAPFMVIATQNPLEFTGTYPLPESQLDRFLMILNMGYPTPDEEREILLSRRTKDPIQAMETVVTAEEVDRLGKLVTEVRMDDTLTRYIIDIAQKTRNDRALIAGVSPRGTLHLARAAQAHAMVEGRDFASPDDVKAVAQAVLAHRILEKKARHGQDGRASSQVIKKILGEVPVPQ